MAYRGKEKNILLVKINTISITKKIKKKQRPTGLEGASNKALNP